MPKKLEVFFSSSSKLRPESKVEKIVEEKLTSLHFVKEDGGKYSRTISENWEDIHPLFGDEPSKNLKKQWKDKDFDFQKTKEWIKAGLSPEDAKLAKLLQGEKITVEVWRSPFNDEKKKELKKKYYNYSEEWKIKDAQKWLEKEYPLEKRTTVTELNVNGKDLEGKLKLTGFFKLKT